MTQELATTHQQLAAHDARPNPFALTTFEAVEKMATYISEAGMYGIKKPAQAVTLLMMAYEERITIVQLMRQIHVMEDGKIAQRADWTQAEFEKVGTILWHCRNDEAACATFFLKKDIDDADIERAAKRCELLRELDDLKWTDPRDVAKERKVETAIARIARPGEETVLRTLQNMDSKGTSIGKNDARKVNWATSSESMLQWRVVTAGVKVVAPGVLNGMPSEIELRDVIDHERREKARISNTATISQDDVPAILGIIAQHDAELATDIPDGRRKTVQGLRMDLVCKLADIGVKPPTEPDAPKPTVGGIEAKTVDTVVLPPDQAATAKQPATRRQRTAATTANAAPADDIDQTPRAAEQGMDTPWREFICLRGQSPGMMHGHTLESIFLGKMKPDTELKLEKLVGWFTAQAIPTSSDPHDKALWHHVQEAQAELRAGFAPGTPAMPASTPTTPAAQKPAQQGAKATDWREFVIPGRHPDFAGKTLGSLGAEGLKRLQDEYLVQIEWSKATLPQKSLKAHVAMAMAELFPKAEDLPPAASEAAFDHVKVLTDILTANKWDAGFFITQCKLNAWIAEEVRAIEDISAEEYAGLEQGWPTVEEEMAKAHQPAKHP